MPASGELQLDRARQVAEQLLERRVSLARLESRGRNSALYRVDSSIGRYALKEYVVAPGQIDRLNVEVGALELMARNGIAHVPRVVATEEHAGYALLTWIDGRPTGRIDDSDIAAATDFLAEIHALGRDRDARSMPLAAEACLSGDEIRRQVEERLIDLRQLADEGDLQRLVESEVVPLWRGALHEAQRLTAESGVAFADTLPADKQSLVPSDFGFHNALRTSDGSLVFLDFEYFGWDDPVKMTADFLLHPGYSLTPGQRAAARASLCRLYGSADPEFDGRLDAYLPLFGVRWVLIMLNDFLPRRWQRRLLAGKGLDWQETKARQLARARVFLDGLPSRIGRAL